MREARERVHAPCGHHHDRRSRRGRVMATSSAYFPRGACVLVWYVVYLFNKRAYA